MIPPVARRLCLGVLVSLVVTACSAPPAPAPAQPPVPSDTSPVTITFWHAQAGNARGVLVGLTADFQKAYPWITINADAKNSESDLYKLGIAAMALNQLPDLFLANPRTVADFGRRGVLAPFDSFLGQEKIGLSDDERADFFPGMIDLTNQLYAFPFDEDAVVLYYNSDMLQAAKIPIPPKTWDEFAAAARATTRGEVRGWAMTPAPAVYGAMLFSRGSSVLDDSQTKIQFNDEGGQKTLQTIAALARGGAAYTAPQARDDFIQGKTALLLDTTDNLATISESMARQNRGGQWGVAMIPQSDPAHPVTAVAGNSIGIFRTTETRSRAAWLFARWLAAPEQTARWSRATLAIPLRASSINILTKDAATNPLGAILRGVSADVVPAARALPVTSSAAQIDAALAEMWATVGNGQDPNAAMTRAVTRVNRLLGQIQ
jgi:ABC-type glycerol-3-phosphate transport system substrate-binding protein